MASLIPQTRLYFTKESKVQTLLNVILNSGIKCKSNLVSSASATPMMGPARTKSSASINSTMGADDFYELDYLTQIFFGVYERKNEYTGVSEYAMRIGFSPGAHHSSLIDVDFSSEDHALDIVPRYVHPFLTH
jgi:inositol hexakisphosphate/diphosphoinositol-pentakisphosphate kinase